MIALAVANKCTSNPSLTFHFTLLSAMMAANTIAEKTKIMILAFLSFFFQAGGSMFMIFFSENIITIPLQIWQLRGQQQSVAIFRRRNLFLSDLIPASA